MAKRKKQEKSEAAASSAKASGGALAAGRRRSLPNWPVLAPALAGMALTAYLTATTWAGTAPAFCAEGSSCDVVQTSRWGTLLGLPTAAWGFLAYFALAYIAMRVKDASRHWQAAWLVAAIGLAISAYLTVISLVVIEAACIYCLASLALLALITGIVTLQRPEGIAGFSWPAWGGQGAVIAIVLVTGLHLHFSGTFNPAAGPEDPYLMGLAEHLKTRGDIFYGAFW